MGPFLRFFFCFFGYGVLNMRIIINFVLAIFIRGVVVFIT